MVLKEAINILDEHNKWRRGLVVEMKYTPKEIGDSIDLILKQVKNNDCIADVVGSVLIDHCATCNEFELCWKDSKRQQECKKH